MTRRLVLVRGRSPGCPETARVLDLCEARGQSPEIALHGKDRAMILRRQAFRGHQIAFDLSKPLLLVSEGEGENEKIIRVSESPQDPDVIDVLSALRADSSVGAESLGVAASRGHLSEFGRH